MNQKQQQPTQAEVKSGIELIRLERARQIIEEGFTSEHDDKHKSGELLSAAQCYLWTDRQRRAEIDYDSMTQLDAVWPWDREWWKPTPRDRIRELTKAGALIAAEIDRLQLAKAKGRLRP